MLGRTITAVLALGLLSLAAPQAQATGDDSTFRGSCGFTTLNDTTPGGTLGGPETWTGEVDSDVVLYSRTHGNVVTGTVTCVLEINGVPQQSYSRSGAGAVVFVAPMSFTASVTDVVTLCTGVDYTSDSTPSTLICAWATTTQIPPQEVVDLITFVIDLVDYAFAYTAAGDPTICPLLQSLAPGAEPVTITPEGDTFLDGEMFWDCPPYENPIPPDAQRTGLTGGGWDDGDTGFLTLLSPNTTTVGLPADTDRHDVASTCAFRTDHDAGTITVTGRTATNGADLASVHCRLQDANGTVLYDHAGSATGPLAALDDTVPAIDGKVSVCTEGSGTWHGTTVTTGFYCRLAA